MLILVDSKLYRFFMALPTWTCWIEAARVGHDTTSFVIISRPYWLKRLAN